MRESRRLILNAAANAAGRLARLLVGFVLPPLVIAGIGSASFGFVVMVGALLEFAGALRLGTPQALTRFLSQAVERGDVEEQSRVASTGMALLSLVGAAILLLSGLAALQPQRWLAVPEGLDRETAGIVVICLGLVASSSVVFTLGQVGFYARERFVTLNVMQTAGALLRLALIVGALYLVPGSVIAYAVGHSASLLITQVAVLALGFYLLRGVRVRLALVDRARAAKVLGYGLQVLGSSLLFLLYIQADYLLIGHFFDTASVTLFTLAVTWSFMPRRLFSFGLAVVLPSAARKEAAGDEAGLRLMLVRGTKYALLLCVPIATFLIVFRQRIFLAWMGEGYAESAALVVPLVVAELLAVGSIAGANMFIGLGKVGFFVRMHLIFGPLNVVLALLLGVALEWGLSGFAFAYLLATVPRVGLVLPVYMARTLKLGAGSLYRLAYWPAVLAGLVSAPICVAIEGAIDGGGWGPLLLSAALFGACYLPLAYLLSTDAYDRQVIGGWLAGRTRRA